MKAHPMPSIRTRLIRRYFPPWKWSVWFQWLLINTLAWMGAFWTLTKTRELIEYWLIQLNIPWTKSVVVFPGALVFGVVLGYSQSRWLRKTLRIPDGWTRATTVALFLLQWRPVSLNPLFYRIGNGAVMGLAQWLILRKKFPEHSWWIVLSGGSWMAGKFASEWASQYPIPPIVCAGIHGLVYGILTGVGILALFQYASSPHSNGRLRNASPRKEIFLVSWIIMNSLGWFVGFGRIGQNLWNTMMTGLGLSTPLLLEKAVFEGLAAFSVCFVLWRQRFRGSFWWVIWSGIGAAAGIFLWQFLKVENATGIVIYGLVVGFFQWFILSQQVRGFWLWMGTRTVAWAGSLVIVSKMSQRFTLDIGWGAGGLAYGILTGVLLFWRFQPGKGK